MEIEILYEDASVIVAVKPPGISTQPDKTGDMDFLSLLQEQCKGRGDSGEAISPVQRLDRPVGGVILFAKTRQAAANLTRQMAAGTIQKKYYAVLCGEWALHTGELRNFLWKNERKNLSMVAPKGTKQAKEAVLTYRIMECRRTEEFGALSLAEVNLLTGRHHQIRVQFAHAGHPLLGDRKYQKERRGGMGRSPLGLWAYALSFQLPDGGKEMSFCKMPVEKPFSLFFTDGKADF